MKDFNHVGHINMGQWCKLMFSHFFICRNAEIHIIDHFQDEWSLMNAITAEYFIAMQLVQAIYLKDPFH